MMTIDKEEIIANLREVYDPEISINVYDLGLIYDISIDEKESSVNITATLTSAFCPFADQITEDMQKAGYTKDGNVLSVNVDITFDPPFTMDSVSDEAKLMMGW
jgi:metal-sulfur cluster biosynthetic enzyme